MGNILLNLLINKKKQFICVLLSIKFLNRHGMDHFWLSRCHLISIEKHTFLNAQGYIQKSQKTLENWNKTCENTLDEWVEVDIFQKRIYAEEDLNKHVTVKWVVKNEH